MKYNLMLNDNVVMDNIIAKNENHAWTIVKKMGIKNRSKIYTLEGIKNE